MRLARIPALFLPAVCGCGLFLNQSVKDNTTGLYVYSPPEEPAHALLVEGEIRDFVSLRAEPHAAIETWTDDAEYAPKAHIDERGQFSLRIDVCRREATAGEEIAMNVLFGDSNGCARWLGHFHFRARLGDRCSLTYSADTLPKEPGPLVLWLRPCTDVESVQRPQRVER